MMLWRLGFPVLNRNCIGFQGLTSSQTRKEFPALSLLRGTAIAFPAITQRHFQGELEVRIAAGNDHFGFLVAIRLADCYHHLTANKFENILFSRGKLGNLLKAGRSGGNNSVMVSNLTGIAKLFAQNRVRDNSIANAGCPQNKCFYAAKHIIRQIAAVCPRIGAQFLFIERLQIVQRLLGSISQQAVGISL